MIQKTAQLRFELLGTPRLLRAGEPLALSSSKGKALLFYLATTRRAQPRSALAHLLWSEMPDRKAHTNLRVTLSKLRKAAGSWLQIDRDRVAWRPEATVWTDVAVFEEACAGGDREAWNRAVELYRGDFLKNFSVPAAPVFDEWVLLEQERLHQMLYQVLHRLITLALNDAAQTDAGIAHARRLLAVDPWREEAHRHLMTLLARSGRRGEALAQFESCRHILAEEFGSEPGPETRTLFEAIRDNTLTSTLPRPSATTSPIPHNLPAPTTSFIGREAALAQAGGLLADPGCRLVTLSGPGGIGKTRLVLAVAQQALSSSQFVDGIYLVTLARVETEADLINAVAQALDLTLTGVGQPAQQVADSLAKQKMLLLLDNFEHVAEHAPLLVRWLEAAAGLKIVVTSRERLHLLEEWVLDVRGLSAPDSDWSPETAEWAETLQTYPAIRLFVERARRVHLRFDPLAEAQAIATICRLTGGLPLALELAAVWVRSFACAEIAAELRQSLDFLTSASRNRPQRHQSMRAAFDYSWRLLHEREKIVLGRLTVFQGSFSLAAAKAVARAAPRMLAQLVDKSLVQRQANGRYQMHELLRQFAAKALPDPAAAARDHAHYFAGLLVQQTTVLRGPDPEPAVAALLPDISNLRAAWRWLVANGELEAMDRALLSLFELYDARSWYVEGERLLSRAAAAAGEQTVLAARLAALRARFLTRQGRLSEAEDLVRESLAPLQSYRAREYGDALNNLNNILRRVGRYDEARGALDKAQIVYEESGFRRGLASVLNNRGLAAYRQGDYETAAALQQRSADLYRQTGPRKDLATVLNNLGLSRLNRGEFAAAEAALQESANTAEEIGYHGCLVVATQNLGVVAMQEEMWEAAERRLLRSLQLAEEVGMQDMAGHVHNDLCVLYERQGDVVRARKHGEAALALSEQLGMQWLAASAQGNLANVALAEGHVTEAEGHLWSGLSLVRELQAQGLRLDLLLGWAALLQARKQPEEALRIVATVLPVVGHDPDQLERAETLLADLRSRVDGDRRQLIEAEAASLSPQALVQSLTNTGR